MVMTSRLETRGEQRTMNVEEEEGRRRREGGGGSLHLYKLARLRFQLNDTPFQFSIDI